MYVNKSERAEDDQKDFWNCEECGSQQNGNNPNLYCIDCGYDLCDNCFFPA